MWTCECTLTSDATPSEVWARYAEPSTWPEWDAAAERVTLQGQFAVGSRGTLKPRRGPTTWFTLVDVAPEVAFTSVTRLPLARLEFRHRIQSTPTGSRLTHTVTIRGPMSALFARLVGASIARDLPPAMAALARLAVPPPPTPVPVP